MSGPSTAELALADQHAAELDAAFEDLVAPRLPVLPVLDLGELYALGARPGPKHRAPGGPRMRPRLALNEPRHRAKGGAR